MKDDELIKRFSKLYSALIADNLDKLGLRDQTMDYRIRPVYPEALCIGRAVTLLSVQYYKIPENPYQVELEAIDNLKGGEVIIGTTNGELTAGFWGELMATGARARGAVGAVTDGLVRDPIKLTEMKYPTFARGYTPQDSNGRSIIIEYNVPIICGEVKVNPGDLVFADFEGIVIIPKGNEEKILYMSEEKLKGEDTVREELESGVKITEVFEKYHIL